jgi:hypothetical protein
MTEQKPKRKFSFICMEEDCMKDVGPCVIEMYAEEMPDHPSWCPWEFDPNDRKYKLWRSVGL